MFNREWARYDDGTLRAIDGSWISYGDFGQDTYGLHLPDDHKFKGMVFCIRTDPEKTADKLLNKLNAGWVPVNLRK